MSKNNKWLLGKITINTMDKSTSEIKGVLLLENNSNTAKTIKDINLDVYVLNEGISPLLLQTYTFILNKEFPPKSSLDYPIELDGILLSSLASEIVDLQIGVRGTNIKTLFNITRTYYIDLIEETLTNLGYELTNYSVDIKNKLISKLFRQYYIYKHKDIHKEEDIKITYTPNKEYLRVCIYKDKNKSCKNLNYNDIVKKDVLNKNIEDIFKELKIYYIENTN